MLHEPVVDAPERTYHRWRYFDPVRRRWTTARHIASESHARRMVEIGEWVDPSPIPGTRVVREPLNQDAWQITGIRPRL